MKKIMFFIICTLMSVSVFADPRVIAVTGKGSFEREADWLRVSFSVVSQEQADVAKAREEVEQKSKSIAQALLKMGVGEADIRSQNFNVDSREHFNRQDCPEKVAPVVSRDIEVLVRNLGQYQKVLDALVNNGANRISHVSAELSNQKTLEKEAMLQAMQDAKEQAKFLVEGLGAQLGPVHSIGDRQTNRGPQFEVMRAAGMQKDAGSEPYDFKPKPVEVNASIYVEYLIE